MEDISHGLKQTHTYIKKWPRVYTRPFLYCEPACLPIAIGMAYFVHSLFFEAAFGFFTFSVR